jgi:hypothetical protein
MEFFECRDGLTSFAGGGRQLKIDADFSRKSDFWRRLLSSVGIRRSTDGADWVNCARGFMFAIGCIQSQSCHTNRCPTGVATQDKLRQRALVVPDKVPKGL